MLCCSAGDIRVLGVDERFKLLGNIEGGTHCLAIENNLFQAPLFDHSVPETDFLLTLMPRRDSPDPTSARASVTCGVIRRVNRTLIVGQGEPLRKVPEPAPLQNVLDATSNIVAKYIATHLVHRLSDERIRVIDEDTVHGCVMPPDGCALSPDG